MKNSMRALLTGFFHETNTYVPAGDLSYFTRSQGQELIDNNRGANTPFGGYIDFCENNAIEMVGGVHYLGNPCGLVSRQDYQTMKNDILDAARNAGDIDFLMLWMHGAACVEGLDDPEADTVQSLKEILGDDVTVLMLGVDLHGKCSDALNQLCDWFSAVHTYPHVDYAERTRQCLAYLPGVLDGSITPSSHVEFLPLIFPPATTMGDGIGAKILARIKQLVDRGDILDVSYLHGFPYADHPFTGGFVVVITDNDPVLAESEARDLAQWIWGFRQVLNEPVMAIEEAVQATAGELRLRGSSKQRPRLALDTLDSDTAAQELSVREAKEAAWGFVPDWDAKPIVLFDAGDNPGGGTIARSTHLLRRLMEENIERCVFLGLCDPVVASAAHAAGVGAVIDVELGGGDELLGAPIKAKAYVKTLADGRTMNRLVAAGVRFDVGLVARILIGPMEIIVNSNPWQGFDNAQALIGGVDVMDYDVVALKSSAHFRAYFESRASKIFPADGPGGTTGELNTFKPTRLRGPVYPFDLETRYP